MTIRYNCEGCGASLNIKNSLAGTDGKCPKCKRKFTVPQLNDEELAVSALMMDDDGQADGKSAGDLSVGSQPQEQTDESVGGDQTEAVPAASSADIARNMMKHKKGTQDEALDESDITVKPQKSWWAGDEEAEEEKGAALKELVNFLGWKAIPLIVAAILFLYGINWFSKQVLLGGDGLPELASVNGTVTVDGEPLVGALVVFEPVGDGDTNVAKLAESVDMTDVNGEFTLVYVQDAEGAVIGKHLVTISAQDENGVEMQLGEFSTSLKIVDVNPGSNTFPFAISTTK